MEDRAVVTIVGLDGALRTKLAEAALKAAAEIQEWESLTGDSFSEMGACYEQECPEAGSVTTTEMVEAARDGHRGWDVFRAAAMRNRVANTGRAPRTAPVRKPTTATRRGGHRSHASRRSLAGAGSRGDPDEPSDDAKPGNRANLVGSEKEINDFLLEQEREDGRARIAVTCSYCNERTRGTRKTILAIVRRTGRLAGGGRTSAAPL